MFKKHEKIFSFSQKLLDGLVIGLCWNFAYHFRFHYVPFAQKGLGPLFFNLTPLVVILTLYSFYKFGLYSSQRFNSRLNEIGRVFQANFIANLGLVVILYFFTKDKLSRLTLIYYFFLSHFFLIIVRILVRNFLRYLRKKGKNLRHVLLIGNGKQIENYINSVKEFKDSGIRFLGWIDGGNLPELKKIKTITSSLNEAKNTLKPDAIIIGYDSVDWKKVDEIVKENFDDIVPLQILPDLTYSFIGHKIEEFAGIPILSINQPNLDGLGVILKRSLDFIGGCIGLILFAPLGIIISIIIKISDNGPIFYGQERMGLDGKPFTMWKFRTMKIAKHGEDQTTWTKENDPRKTPFGNFLRKTSIDEVPQFWNVIIGNMSLVGPRPERPYFVDKFKKEIPGYMLRHKMKSGITGWAQINGWRGDTSIFKRIEFDNFYIKNWTIWLDLRILFLTFWKGFTNKNAY